MNEKKNKPKSNTLGKFTGAEKNNCYGNSVAVLQVFSATQPEGWFYVEGVITAGHETEGPHHAWTVHHADLIDPTEPNADLVYHELKRWAAAEFLELIKQDLELPLTDMSGSLRAQNSIQGTGP